MKKRFNRILFLVFISIGISACSDNWCGVEGVGPIETQNRYLSSFDGVDLELSGNVRVTQDSVFSVEVTTYSNYHSLIQTYVRNGTLVIDSDKSLRDDDVRIEIHLPYLEYLSVGGSGSIVTTNYFNASYVKLQIAGSGKIDFAGSLSFADALISGSGDIYLNGHATNGKMTISGSGNIHAFPLTVLSNKVTISGSGNVETSVTSNLEVTISGSGDVYYMGYPTLSVNVTGSGNVVHRN
ncbi:MAG: DUF2807 domain-containing protein [Bacteroidetes bacterium]|nr:DUF2807 domain-containing protein [Bacteroidota bacterium]